MELANPQQWMLKGLKRKIEGSSTELTPDLS